MNSQKGIWELEDGCIDIQSGEKEKKKGEEKRTKPHKPVGHQKMFQYNHNERGVRKGQVKNT